MRPGRIKKTMQKNPDLSQVIKSILILPFNVTVTIPFILVTMERPASSGFGSFAWIMGIGTILIGFCLMFTTITLFFKMGKGTLTPWDPTQRLVLSGPYRYVRNPMISGVIFILLGEVLIFRSFYLLCWLIIFAVINHIYFVWVEEPGLSKRFGKAYEEYKKNVPRWIPRIKPWGGQA
jgi:protein-S-isoprenylcysteine O-methyltransferase Ste14